MNVYRTCYRDMNKYFLIALMLVLVNQHVHAQLVDKTPAAIPNVPTVYNTEPWEDPTISGINRDPARATGYSFTSVNDALVGERTKSTRMISLNGDWDFSFAIKP